MVRELFVPSLGAIPNVCRSVATVTCSSRNQRATEKPCAEQSDQYFIVAGRTEKLVARNCPSDRRLATSDCALEIAFDIPGEPSRSEVRLEQVPAKTVSVSYEKDAGTTGRFSG